MSKTSTREEALFADALAQPPAQRESFLAQACGADAALLARIAALIVAHEGPESLLSPSPPKAGSAATSSARSDLIGAGSAKAEEKPGDLIGRYKLLQRIGEGGCGVVWMAEQEEPVRRRVALKVIKLGMDTKAVVARFEAERQALAMMDHPCIAKVLDGGVTDTGRPYFVMELVRGIPITRFCDDNKLPTKERLNLFISVCHAIQHAHQKGIIHRDIKPSNVLVTLHDEAAVPMVIDFGIAKATQGRLTDQTLFTAFEQFIGTPVYMAPEQAEYNALDVDTRSDIYSLGVLLYELLTGRPPFDPKTLLAGGIDQIRRVIRETEPPRPSTRVRTLTDEERTTVASVRGIAPAQLPTLLRGDLDWIVMKALEKNRVRRYQTANAFAMDVLRYLGNEPVVARPPSAAYRFRKFASRHKLAFGSGCMVFISLVGGLTFSTVSFTREKTARGRALAAEQSERAGRQRAETAEAGARYAEKLTERARSEAEGLLGFMFTDMADQLNEFGHLPILLRVSERAVAYYDGLPAELRTRDTRAGHAAALARLGAVQMSRGEMTTADATFQKSATIFEELERSGPLTAAMRVAYGGMLESVTWRHVIHGFSSEAGSSADRGENIVKHALNDPELGGWAERTLAKLLWNKGFALMRRSEAGTAAIVEFQRALELVESSERKIPQVSRPGLLAAQMMPFASEAFWNAGRRGEARVLNERGRVELRRFLQQEPFLIETRRELGSAAWLAATYAQDEWDFAAFLAANEEAQSIFSQLLTLNPKNVRSQNDLAVSIGSVRGGGRFSYNWRFGDFAAARATTQNAIELLSVDWAPHFMLHSLMWVQLNCARVCAATDRNEEANRHIAEAQSVHRRSLGDRELGRNLDFDTARCEVEFQRLNFAAVRRNAEDVLQRLASLQVESHNERRLTNGRRNAHRDVMRAAFEMGDYTAARHALDGWAPDLKPPTGDADLQQRFDYVGRRLMRIHVCARAGEKEVARDEIVQLWPEVERVFDAGPAYLFNQVQFARALSIRAEIDGNVAEKRAWLDRAAGFLRPAAAAGRLTRYEREVLLAGIEKQLGALPTD